MATYEQAIEALKRADAAGNTEDARKLAQLAASLKPQADAQPMQATAPEQNAPQQPANPQDQGYLSGLTDNALQGASLGLADEVGAAGAGTGAALVGAFRGQNPINAFSTAYDKRLGQIRGTTQQFASDNPKAALAANLAGGMAAFSPQKVAATVSEAPSVLNAMVRGARAAAPVGALYGFNSGEGGFKNRAAGAAFGGATSALMGAAIPGIGYLGGKILRTGSRMLGNQNPTKEANALLARALNGDELTPAELQTRIGTQNGKPITIADIAGDNTRTLADQVSLQGGKGSNRLNAFLDQRQADQNGRVLGDIKTYLSPSTDTYGLNDTLSKVRSASNPIWQKAMDQPPVWNDQLAKFANEPVVKRGMVKGIKLARLDALSKGEPFDPKAYAVTGFNEAGDPIIGGVPTWRTWQAAKEGLDAQITDSLGPHGEATKMSNALKDVKNSLLNNLDSANPVYKAARAAWAGPSAQKEAITVGQKALRLAPDEIAKATSKMAPDELAAFRVGFARALQDKTDTTAGLGDVTKKIFNNNRIKDQIEAGFGKGAYTQFEDAIASEKTMAGTREFVRGNSRTAQRLFGAQNAGDHIAQGFTEGLAHGGAVGAPLSGSMFGAAKGLANSLVSRGRGLNGPTGEVLSNILTETNPDLQRSILQGIMSQKAAEQSLLSKKLGNSISLGLLGSSQLSPLFAQRAN